MMKHRKEDEKKEDMVVLFHLCTYFLLTGEKIVVFSSFSAS